MLVFALSGTKHTVFGISCQSIIKYIYKYHLMNMYFHMLTI